MRQLTAIRESVQTWRSLEKRVNELFELTTLAIKEADYSPREEIQQEAREVASNLEKLELQLTLSGEHDARNTIMSIHAGAGGTESQDWAEMLLRMYLRWAERRNYQAEVLDTSAGEEAGIRNAIIEIRGGYAYGYLKSEFGVHRLVRLSPFDADHARHTSFALVEVLPEAKEDLDTKINPADLKIDTFRASGPGGQHMQKTSTAVRITHLPSGLIATCQSQRSQHQNKEAAMKVLYARLLELEQAEKEAERTKLKGERVEAGWGNQIRSYVLHPYKMVKDHRTNCETSNTAAVLDGEIDEFITAYLQSQVGKNK